MTNSIHVDSKTNVGNVSNSYNIISLGANEESFRIHSWLSPLEPHRRHNDVRNRRLDGVGDWVLQKNEFESWRNSGDGSPNRTLLCYGGQGVGKTYISSLVIDTLCAQSCGQNSAILSLYCDYQAQRDQTAVNMIGGLLKQVAAGVAGVPGEVRSVFEGLGQRGDKSLRLPEMLKLFIKTIGSFERVYICFDAVDELLPQNRSEFLRGLRQVMGETSNIRLFLTGRPYIRKELDKHLTNGAYIIHIMADQGDIARYISQKMDDDDDRDPDLMTEDLKKGIMKTIAEKSSEMFLLVTLNIDAILGETSLSKRKEMLQKVATSGVDLDNVYAQTLQRIREQKGDRSRLGMEVLTWISHAERPLRVDELCHALASEVGKQDLDPDDIRPEDTVLGSCLGLAVVDQETSTVRLIHYTLQEYLCRPGILPDTHKTLAESYLAYLHYEPVMALPARKLSNLGYLPFLAYSSLHWGTHAKAELSSRGKSLALELLSRFDNHISATLLSNQIIGYHNCLQPKHSFLGLHCASYFGIVDVVADLIVMKGCDINQRDCRGFTPLMWAAHQGNEQVVRLLLSRSDIKPDTGEGIGRTALWLASYNGHEGVVRPLLLRGDVNPDKSDNNGETPLWAASYNGHEGIVRLLLAQDNINPDKPHKGGETPLWAASCNGHNEVVRLLLAQDSINPDKPDNNGQTPLGRASSQGHAGVVGLLLSRGDVNPDKQDNNGQAPLWVASHNGHEGAVRLLLSRGDVNPDKPSKYGQTPLWAASCNEHEGVVRLLLAQDDVNADKPNNYGETPLWMASYNGHEGVVRLLLSRDEVNPDEPSICGQTPLWAASYNGHEGVVRLLLSRDEVNPNKSDNDGETPLWRASRKGHGRVVRLLLSRDDVNPDKPNNDGETPLWRATLKGHEEVVRLLLSCGDVNPDKQDKYGRTPLWWASFYGHGGVVRLLLGRDDADPHKLDKRGRTPLQIASMYGRTEIIALFQHQASASSMPD